MDRRRAADREGLPHPRPPPRHALREVDIIAARRDRIAFVEVKQRATRDDAEAALTPHQGDRIGRAADYWLAKHPRYLQREVGLDAVLVTPRGWPRHIPNAIDRM